MQTTRREGTERGGIGQGIYSLAELRLYLAFYAGPEVGDRALYWLETALNPVDHQTRKPDYSFSDLISLLVVSELVGLGMQPHRIQEAEGYLRDRSRTARPFVNQEIATDGKTLFIRSDVEEQMESANHGGGQQAHGRIIGPFLKRVSYTRTADADWAPAISWSPTDRIVLSPRVQFGEPVIDGTRVPTAAVAEIAAVAGVEETTCRLSITSVAARAALDFERRLEALR